MPGPSPAPMRSVKRPGLLWLLALVSIASAAAACLSLWRHGDVASAMPGPREAAATAPLD